MSDLPTDDERDADSDRDRDADGQFDADWLSSLRAVLEALENGPLAARGSRDDQRNRRSLEFGISIGSIDDALADLDADTDADVDVDKRRGRRPGRTPAGSGGTTRRGGSRSRREPSSRRSDVTKEYPVTTRQDDDELCVVADLAGVDSEAVTVGFDDSRLIVAVEGTELERVAVPWESRDAAATFKNGVLTVRVDRQRAGSGDEQ